MSVRLLLAGYFGSGNLGDDAILLGFCEAVKELQPEIRVIAGSPELLLRQYGLRGVIKTDMGAIKQAIADCDALVFPGGSIFQDVTSIRSVAYYSRLVSMAKSAGKKVVMVGQGVGPLKTFLGRQFAVGAFNKANGIAVRDQDSMKALKDLGVKTPVRAAADMALLMPTAKLPDGNSFGVAGMKTVGIAPRPWGKDRNKKVVQLFGELMRLLSQNNFVPVMVEMDRNEDGPLIQQVSSTQGGKVPEVRGLSSPLQFQERIGRMEAVIAMRLHAGILAAAIGVPPFMVSYDPKVTAFAKQIGQSSIPGVDDVNPQRLLASFLEFMKTRERTVAELARTRESMQQQALTNIEVLRGCLGK